MKRNGEEVRKKEKSGDVEGKNKGREEERKKGKGLRRSKKERGCME